MKKKSTLKTAFMSTVAAGAFAGFATIAAAQNTQGPAGGGAMNSQGAQQEHRGGAASGATGGASTLHQQSGAQSGNETPSGQPAQQSPEAGQSTGQNSTQSEKGANEKNTRQKGAQTEHNTQLKGAQEERNEHGAQTDRGKGGTGATQQNAQGSVRGGAASRGAPVQLSQDQRSRIGAIIGKNSAARLSAKPDFEISVGARVPRDIHVTVMPQDVVQVVPQYEGYDYIVVGDQILIVDPDSMEIVAVIET